MWATKAERQMIKCVFRISPDLDLPADRVLHMRDTGPPAEEGDRKCACSKLLHEL